MTLKVWTIPPLIEQWINQLHDPNVPEHIKENYKMMLTNVAEACQTEVTWFNTVRFKITEKKSRKKG